MRLLRRRREPEVAGAAAALSHPEIERSLVVRAEVAAVLAHLACYSARFSDAAPRRGVPVGSCLGWTRLDLPPAVHPWHLHDLASWFRTLVGPEPDGLVALCGPGPEHEGYWLVPDPRHDDVLFGYDDVGTPLAVSASTNAVGRGGVLPIPVESRLHLFARVGIPTEMRLVRRAAVAFEDPGRALNPSNASTHRDVDVLVRTLVPSG